MRVGIDLSTTQTGIVIMDDDNNVVFSRTLYLDKYSDLNFRTNINKIKEICRTITYYLSPTKNVVGIELSNFSSAKLTQRFSLYSGVFMAELNSDNVEFKLFNSNSWQKFLGLSSIDGRERLKQASYEFAKQNSNVDISNWTQDECDAYCIAYFMKMILTTEQISVECSKRKLKTNKLQRELLTIERQINTILKNIVVLDKERNKKRIENLNAKLTELRNKKEELMNEKRAI